MPLDELPGVPDHPPPPDPAPLFQAIRTHLARAQAAGFLLRDRDAGYYVVVNPSLERVASLVQSQIEWEAREARNTGIMANTGELVDDFEQVYPPDPTPLLAAAQEHLRLADARAAAVPSADATFWVAAGTDIDEVIEALQECKRKMGR